MLTPETDTLRTLRELSFLTSSPSWRPRPDWTSSCARSWTGPARPLTARSARSTSWPCDRPRLTLAATNGSTRSTGQVSLAMGEGVTGAAAAALRPTRFPTCASTARFKTPRFDLAARSSSCRAAHGNDLVVGVLTFNRPGHPAIHAARGLLPRHERALLPGRREGRLQSSRSASSTAPAPRRGPAELLSLVTHELRTPLSVVRAYVDLLADAAGGISDAPARASADDGASRRATQTPRLDRLVDSILVPSTGKGWRPVADAVRRRRRRRRDDRGPGGRSCGTISLRGTPGGAARGLGVEPRFRQVNGAHAGERGEYARGATASPSGPGARRASPRRLVTDDGPGVPIEEWETVFEAFVRKARRRGRGSGIGLYAARRLTGAMGGRVWIEGNGYGGSRFVVALPADGQA